jgi:hypothetical protein
MSAVIGWMERLSLDQAFWIYFGFFVIHELEEWNIARFEKEHFKGLPVAHTDRNARAWIGVICLIIALWRALLSLVGVPAFTALAFLPVVFFALTNALQHLYWSLRFKAYASGSATALLLILPSSIYLTSRVLGLGLVPAWYVIGLSIVAALALAGTVKSGDVMPSVVATVYGIGDRTSRIALGCSGRHDLP